MPFLLLLLFLWPVAAGASATDWVELPDGSRLEGTIVSVSGDEIIMDVQTTPSIREQRVFSRAKLTGFHRARPDDLAFAALETKELPATADNPAVFDAFIEQHVRPFMQEFAYSRHMPAARRILAAAEEERGRVAAGEVKIGGEWIAAGGGGEDPEVGGRVQFALMDKAPDPASALNIFEVIQRDFSRTSVYPEAVQRARQFLDQLRTAAARTRTEMERRDAERAEGMTLARVDQRALMEEGIAREKAALQARLETARQAGLKWIAPQPDAKFLDDLERTIQTEEARLTRLNVAAMSEAVAAADRARASIEDGRLDDARRELDDSQKSWSQYVVLATLRESLQKAEAEAKNRAAAENHESTPES